MPCNMNSQLDQFIWGNYTAFSENKSGLLQNCKKVKICCVQQISKTLATTCTNHYYAHYFCKKPLTGLEANDLLPACVRVCL